MTLLAHALWPGLAAALLLGLGVGALAGLPRERVGRAVAVGLGSALAVLAVLALTGAVPGERGLWIESAALMLTAYLAGCVAGGLSRTASRSA